MAGLYNGSPIIGGDGYMELGEGTYEITSAETLATVTYLRGIPGKTIIKAGTALTQMFDLSSDGLTIEGITIDGNNVCSRGIRIAGATNLLLRDVTIKNVTNNQIYATSGTGLRFENVKTVDGAYGQTFDSESPTDWQYHGFFFDNGTFNDVAFINCEGDMVLKANNAVFDNVLIWGGKYSDNTKMGIEILASSANMTNLTIGGGLESSGNGFNADISINDVIGFHISDVHSEGDGTRTLLELVRCTDGTVRSCTLKGGQNSLLLTNACANITFSGLDLRDADTNAIKVQDSDQLVFTGCHISDPVANAYGFSITNGSNIIITDNYLDGNSTGKKGIYFNFSEAHSDIVYSNNVVKNWTEHEFYLNAGSAVTISRVVKGLNATTNNNAGFAKHANVTYSGSVSADSSALT